MLEWDESNWLVVHVQVLSDTWLAWNVAQARKPVHKTISKIGIRAVVMALTCAWLKRTLRFLRCDIGNCMPCTAARDGSMPHGSTVFKFVELLQYNSVMKTYKQQTVDHHRHTMCPDWSYSWTGFCTMYDDKFDAIKCFTWWNRPDSLGKAQHRSRKLAEHQLVDSQKLTSARSMETKSSSTVVGGP